MRYSTTILSSQTRFPLNFEERMKWIEAIQTYQIFDDKSMQPNFCYLHFKSEDFKRNGKLVHNSVPSVFNGQLSQTTPSDSGQEAHGFVFFN